MKKLLLMLLMLGSIASCSEDNRAPQLDSPRDKKEQQNPGKDKDQSQPGKDKELPDKDKSTQSISYISKIEVFDPYSNKLEEWSYTYDAKMRLISLVKRNIKNNTAPEGRITYSDNTIKMEYDSHKEFMQMSKPSIFHLIENSQHKVTLFEESHYYDDGDKDQYREKNFLYDSSGRCTAYTLATGTDKAKLDWSSGDLTKVTYSGSLSVVDVFTYTTIPNNIYPDLNNFFTQLQWSPIHKSLWSSQLGIKSTKLVKSLRRSGGEFGQLDISCKYDKLDAKERPIQITHTKNGQYVTTFRITYLNK